MPQAKCTAQGGRLDSPPRESMRRSNSAGIRAARRPSSISHVGQLRLFSFLAEIKSNATMRRSIHLGLYYQQTRNLRVHQEKTVRAMYWRGRSFDKVQYQHNARSSRDDWNYRSEIFAFSRRVQENLSEDTLRQVFAHPSYLEGLKQDQTKFNLPDIGLKSNEGLVQRGSSLLTNHIRPYLRFTFDKVPEDGIVQISNYLESDQVLSDIADWIGCKEIILSADYPPDAKTMADTVKAFVSGIEADLDSNRARRFIIDMIISYLNDKDVLDDIWIIPNPEETLKLILKNSSLPEYEPRIMFQTGVKTLEPCHVVGLYVNQKLIGSSAGETLEIAKHCAALDSLQRLFDLKENRAPFVYGEASEKIDYSAYSKEHAYIKEWRINLE